VRRQETLASGVLTKALNWIVCSTDEEESYELVLNEMSQLMKDVVETKGASYRNLWREGFDDALSGWRPTVTASC
jgi:hypothetical protein